MTSTRDKAAAFFDHVRARDADGLAALFADNGCIVMPDGREVAASAIADTYRGIFARHGPAPREVGFVPGPDLCVVELEVQFADGTLRRAADIFRFDAAGKITKLDIYARP
jgi:hypothetical protein